MRFETAIEHLVDNYRYAKSKVWIRDEVAWALYHTWKETDHKTEPSGYKTKPVKDEPQTETQTETQNSNLTFEKDECAKEYEELGLKELKELIKADRKTEPSNSEIPNNCEPKICDTCRYYNSNIPCGSTPSACKEADKFAEEFVDGLKKLKPKVEPQTSPTISKMEQVDKDINVRSKEGE